MEGILLVTLQHWVMVRRSLSEVWRQQEKKQTGIMGCISYLHQQNIYYIGAIQKKSTEAYFKKWRQFGGLDRSGG